MTMPTTVRVSFWILLVGIVLNVIGGIFFVLGGVGAAATNTSLDGETPANSAAVLIISGTIVLALCVVEFVILWKVRSGENWARIVITVLEALALAAEWIELSPLTVLALGIGVPALVLLWVPRSNPFFRRPSHRRKEAGSHAV